jgi:hypothetical protein
MLLSQPRNITSKNPNIFTAEDEILTSNKDPLPNPLPPLKENSKELKFNFKTIFDQPPLKRGLFQDIEDITKTNPNIITSSTTREEVKSQEYEGSGQAIIEANAALQQDNYELAEQILGRPLTPNEIIRKRVSDERVYTLPTDEPSYKAYENLTIVFGEEETSRLIDLQKILTQFGIPFRVAKKEEGYELVSFTKKLPTIYTRPFITTIREQEKLDDDFTKESIENRLKDYISEKDTELNITEEVSPLESVSVKEEIYNIPPNWRTRIREKDFRNNLIIQLGIDTVNKTIPQIEQEIRERLEPVTTPPQKGRPKKLPPPYEEKKGEGLKKIKMTKKNRLLEFGKYMIDPKSLDDNILRFYTRGKSKIHNLPFTYVSRNITGLIRDMMENDGKVNIRMFAMLKDDEKDLMERILRQSRVDFEMSDVEGDNTTGMGYMSSPQLMERLEVLIGSVNAGNDSKEVKNELSNILNALVYRRILTRTKSKMIQKKIFKNV